MYVQCTCHVDKVQITHICPKMFLFPSNGSRMVNFWCVSMLLVLLEPVNRADFKICCLNRKSNTGDIRENIDDYAHISNIFLIP